MKPKTYSVDDLPVYLREWKRDHDKRWIAMWNQHFETMERLKASIPVGIRIKQNPGAIIVGTPEWEVYEKIAEQPRIDLEEWK